MISNYDTLLFDLDGTLTDSNEGILRCLENAIEQMGFEIPEDTNKFLGPPYTAVLCRVSRHEREAGGRGCKDIPGEVLHRGLFENRVYEGIPEMLEQLKKVGKRLMVATSKPEVYAVRILERFGLSQFFEIVGGAELDGSRDYKDEVIEYVLEKAGINDKSRCAYDRRPQTGRSRRTQNRAEMPRHSLGLRLNRRAK